MSSTTPPVTDSPSVPTPDPLNEEDVEQPLEALDALEKEALEFKKVRLSFPLSL
jgi:hypothetical protein